MEGDAAEVALAWGWCFLRGVCLVWYVFVCLLITVDDVFLGGGLLVFLFNYIHVLIWFGKLSGGGSTVL